MMVITLVLFCVFLIMLIYSLYKQSKLRRLGIPGPFPIPFIGNVTLLTKGLSGMDDYLRKKYGNVFGFYVFNTPHIGIADADMIQEICIAQNDNFPNRAASFYMGDFVDRSVSITRDDHWRFTRALMNPMFTQTSISQFMSQILTCVHSLRDNIRQKLGSSIETNEILRAYTMDALLLCGFGVKIDSLNCKDDCFVTCANKVCKQCPNYIKQIIAVVFPETRRLLKDKKITDLKSISAYVGIVKGILEKRQETGERGSDFLQLMIDTQKSEPEHTFEGEKRGMNDDEVLRNGLTLILAGHGTASSAVSWCVYCLARYPQCQEKIRDELKAHLNKEEPPTYDEIMKLEYLDMFVCETLRMFPPPTRFTRNTSKETDVCGRHLNRGIDVSFLVNSIHHDPEKWQEPDTFSPERFSPENRANIPTGHYVPFGMGPRCCIGQHIGLLICKAAILETVSHFRLSLDSKTQIPPAICKGPLVTPVSPIYVNFEELTESHLAGNSNTTGHVDNVDNVIHRHK